MRLNYSSGVSIVLALLTAGCVAPATMPALREEMKTPQVEFTLGQSYQSVYRKLVENARRCCKTGLFGGQRQLDTDIFDDSKTAVLTLSVNSFNGVNVYVGVDIKALDRDRSDVRIFAVKGMEAHAVAIKGWLEQNATTCP